MVQEKYSTLFFPFAEPYPIMEFVVYLNYRGIPINRVALVKAAIAKDSRCMKYRSIYMSSGPSGPASRRSRSCASG